VIFRRAARVAAVLSCPVGGVGVAHAQTSTVPFQGSYRAYNQSDGWKWWLPDKCTLTQPVYGSEPAAPGQYPVVLYLHGTLADWGGNAEGQRVAELAAGQGFVAAAFTFNSVRATQASVDGNAKCMFSPDSSGNAVAQVCARPKADCSKGLLVAGFSAGGAIAARAKNFNVEVEAASVMGVSAAPTAAPLALPAGTRALPDERFRINVGQRDVEERDPLTGQVLGINVSGLNQLTGQSCSTSPCLRADGSGYYVVGHSEVSDGVADHCYWQRVNRFAPTNSCTWTPTFDPGFPPPSTTPWSLTTNLEWLRTKLR
jgi:hypothetical protein